MAQLLDLLLVVAFVLTALAGLKNGFFRELFSILGVLAGVAAGMQFTPAVLEMLPEARFTRSDLATAVVFLVVFLLAFAIFAIGGSLLAFVWEGKSPSFLSRLLGLGVGALRGGLLVTVLAASVALLAPWGSPTLGQSRVLPFLTPGVELGAGLLPDDLGSRLRLHWDAILFARESKQARIRASKDAVPSRALRIVES